MRTRASNSTARDGNGLSLTTREGLNQVVDVLEVGVDPVQHLGGLRTHFRLPPEDAVAAQLPTQEDVRCRIQIAGQREGLVDRFHACAAGLSW